MLAFMFNIQVIENPAVATVALEPMRSPLGARIVREVGELVRSAHRLVIMAYPIKHSSETKELS